MQANRRYLPTYIPTYLPTYLPTCAGGGGRLLAKGRYLPTYLPTNLPTYLPVQAEAVDYWRRNERHSFEVCRPVGR